MYMHSQQVTVDGHFPVITCVESGVPPQQNTTFPPKRWLLGQGCKHSCTAHYPTDVQTKNKRGTYGRSLRGVHIFWVCPQLCNREAALRIACRASEQMSTAGKVLLATMVYHVGLCMITHWVRTHACVAWALQHLMRAVHVC